ncbi:hypothetical protein SAMN05216266_104217 [Amycolatopsis marina]|uniref:Uncharacterized protein n=1 Tax=Amycolatopsis marina TaxID=490629 RepID=A0A1I0Y5T5_9PSEU|nr:hypothetical protein [Amycolatopsis marina]SFB07950.1 hypothetical protein SAMN05216266_104217 [Amycolatopsis marina]
MNDDDIRSLFTDVGTGPPIRLEPEQIIRQGSRIRRRGKGVAIGASALATGAAVFLISVAVSQGQVGSDERIPAGPGPITTSYAPPPSPYSAPATPAPSMEDPGERAPASAPPPGVAPPQPEEAGSPMATR